VNHSALALVAFACAAVVAGCGGGNSAPVTYATPSSGGSCQPTLLPAPSYALLFPLPAATGVPLATTTLYVNGFSTYNSALGQLQAVPVANPTASPTVITLAALQPASTVPSPAATPQPGTTTNYAIPLPTLSPNVTYQVYVVGTQGGSCPQAFTSLAGSFTTGSM
jgi:hypothetical protein